MNDSEQNWPDDPSCVGITGPRLAHSDLTARPLSTPSSAAGGRAKWSCRVDSRSAFLACLWIASLANLATAQSLPFFSGAEGFGGEFFGTAPAAGWFSNASVYHVTNLNDSGAGSFRNAFQENTSNRMIVFDVAGTIQLTSGKVDIKNLSNYYIAGQTAPGPVTIYGDTTSITHSSDKNNTNVIMRYLSFRKGVGQSSDSLTLAGGSTPDDAGRGRHIMIDHVSVSWAEDENLSVANNNTNVTVQHSMITDALGAGHAYGSLVRPRSDSSVTFHHNLYANNVSRQPRLGTYNGELLTADVRNNVVYNWGGRATYAGGSSEPEREYVDVNYVGNYMIAGPATSSNTTKAFIVDKNVDVRAYQAGNRIDSDRQVNPGGIPNGADTGLGMFQVSTSSPQGTLDVLSSPVPMAPVVTQSALDAYQSVIDHAGNSRWGRDAIDSRIVNNVLTNTQPSNGVGASAPVASELSGLLSAPLVEHPAGWDSDGDAMSDEWEIAHGLNPLVGNDWNLDFDQDGYINLVEFVNELGEFPAPSPIVFSGANNGRYAEIGNWDINWQPSRWDEAHIRSGVALVDAVGQRAGTLKIGLQAGDAGVLAVSAGWLEVADQILVGAASGAAGMLQLSGGELRTQRLTRGGGGSFEFTGGVLRADDVEFGVHNQGGTIRPGFESAKTTIQGDYTHGVGSLLELHLGGLAAGVTYSVLDVAGSLALAGGWLDVSFANGFVPSFGDSFDVLDFGSLQGTFAEIVLPGGRGQWNVSRLESDGILSFVGTLAGDFNADESFDCLDVDALVVEIAASTNNLAFDITGDGVVDVDDLGQWLAHAGAVNLPTGEAYRPGDANLDGSVDTSDFNIWNANKFGSDGGWCGADFNADGVTDVSDFGVWNSNKFTSSSAPNVVPEPAGGCWAHLWFICLAMIGYLRHRSPT